MYSKYDNMHENGMIYGLIFINNHIITSINYKLSCLKSKDYIRNRDINQFDCL